MRIYTFTLNPALDVFTEVERLEPSRKLRCTQERRDPGGGGVNVARVIHRLGSDVVAVFAAGGATGQMLAGLVQREGIPSLRIEIEGDTREDFSVFEKATGRQYRFVMPGPFLREREQEKCLSWIATLDLRPKVLVISGGLPPGAPDDFYARAIALAKERGAKIALDASGAALRAALAQGVCLVKPNLRELRELVGHGVPDDTTKVAACRRLVNEGRAEMVALSLAEQGAMLVTRAGAWIARPPRVDVVSVVGAGDSFLGGFLQRWTAADDPADALRFGAAAGSAAVLNAGTELCHADDARKLYGQVALEPLG